jgi:hypothetical protein
MLLPALQLDHYTWLYKILCQILLLQESFITKVQLYDCCRMAHIGTEFGFAHSSFPAVAECNSVIPVCKYLENGTVTTLTGPVPCTIGATWNFTGVETPTQDGQVACSIPGNPVATQKLAFTGGSLHQCGEIVQDVNFTSYPTGNICPHQVQLGAASPPGKLLRDSTPLPS